MNNACTVCECYIGIADYIIGFFALFFANIDSAVEERLIFFIFKFFPCKCFENFICRSAVFGELAENRVKKLLCHIVGVSVCGFDLCIGVFGIYAKCDV